MSYCSDVAITMFQEDYDRMVEQANATGDKDIIAIVTTIPEVHDLLESNGKNIVRLGYNCVKWYSSFDDVGFVENFLNSGIAYHLIVIKPYEKSGAGVDLKLNGKITRRNKVSMREAKNLMDMTWSKGLNGEFGWDNDDCDDVS